MVKSEKQNHLRNVFEEQEEQGTTYDERSRYVFFSIILTLTLSCSRMTLKTQTDVLEERQKRLDALRKVRAMPDGLVKTEMIKSLKNIEKMLDGEMEASKLAWKIEPILERIETSKVKVRNGADSLVLLAHCVLEESGLIPHNNNNSSECNKNIYANLLCMYHCCIIYHHNSQHTTKI